MWRPQGDSRLITSPALPGLGVRTVAWRNGQRRTQLRGKARPLTRLGRNEQFSQSASGEADLDSRQCAELSALLVTHVEEKRERVRVPVIVEKLGRVEMDVPKATRTLKRDRVFDTVHPKINDGHEALRKQRVPAAENRRETKGDYVFRSKANRDRVWLDRDPDWPLNVGAPNLARNGCRHYEQREN
jgi:hypothetical protein